MIRPVQIGKIPVDPPVVLAPMAGVTNHAFRLICRRLGAGLVWTEMISSYGIKYRNPRTLSMFDWTPEERPVAVQLFGADPRAMANAAKVIEESGADIVDINVGCPVPKVRRTGAGAALCENLESAREVMESVVRAVKIPVTIKTRKGLNDRITTAVEVARIAEDAGVSAIAIHGRTAEQGYSGAADWGIIAEVKESVRIPVIGNGDVKSPDDARRMLDQTGCDAVMIGRASLGNPWIFRRTAHFLATGELLAGPTNAERVEVALEHLRMMIELCGEDRGIREMRGQVAWYVRGMPGAAGMRRTLSQATVSAEMEDVLRGLCT